MKAGAVGGARRQRVRASQVYDARCGVLEMNKRRYLNTGPAGNIEEPEDSVAKRYGNGCRSLLVRRIENPGERPVRMAGSERHQPGNTTTKPLA